MRLDNNQQAFFALMRAGLWEKDVCFLAYEDIEWQEVYRLATEQSVLGLVLAGLEHSDVKPPQVMLLQWIGEVQMIEQRNKKMNAFIAELIEKLRNADVNFLLVKGQGIAQCYKNPLWRVCGDIDLLLSDINYERAKNILIPFAVNLEGEYKEYKHFGMTMPGGFLVELHGTLHSHLSRRVDSVIDDVQRDAFEHNCNRVWENGCIKIPLPCPDDDVIFVFTHILQHFFSEGIGLRQICDWCRLLYTYRDSLNHNLLESRLRKMGLLSHWKAFAALAVGTLGMPMKAMPLYNDGRKWQKKGGQILVLILESGNFGHSRDQSYKKNFPKLIEYAISFWVFTRYGIRQFVIFPSDAVRGWMRTISLGVKSKMKKK